MSVGNLKGPSTSLGYLLKFVFHEQDEDGPDFCIVIPSVYWGTLGLLRRHLDSKVDFIRSQSELFEALF